MTGVLGGLIAAYPTPVTSSFESIATATGGAATISFTSIPSTYKHLQIRVLAQDNTSTLGNLVLQFNTDTGTNYTRHYLTADGSTVSAAGSTAQSNIIAGQIYGNSPASSIYGMAIWDIQDYADTSKYKTVRVIGGYDANGTGNIRIASGLWLSTAAITSIELKQNSGSAFSSGSTFALYGIKGA
jgi:hypothetical protein